MLQLIVRMTTVALLLICGAMLDHAPRHPHHSHPAAAAGAHPVDPPSCDAADHVAATADNAHLAHPCTPGALPQQPITGAIDLPLVTALPAADDSLAAAAAAADAAHPPGRHPGTVLSLTSVYRS
jgi:hypothetical protein